jgi:hypothetical protein
MQSEAKKGLWIFQDICLDFLSCYVFETPNFEIKYEIYWLRLSCG